jgi:nitrite reductase/ring-hydroxylating ferredoxin subunit
MGEIPLQNDVANSAGVQRKVNRHVVATVDELPPGSRKLVTVKGRQVAIFNVSGEYFGIFNLCPHQGGSLCQGALLGLTTSDEPGTYKLSRKGEMLRCPWHGWEFDVRTGQSWCAPDTIRTRSYNVEVEAGAELIKGPYIAETFPVTIDQNYVILEM